VNALRDKSEPTIEKERDGDRERARQRRERERGKAKKERERREEGGALKKRRTRVFFFFYMLISGVGWVPAPQKIFYPKLAPICMDWKKFNPYLQKTNQNSGGVGRIEVPRAG
jgi:hypothetical protein